ncbi:MAG: OB-fold nucleic acid binding domain-containing protein, partial [bacterium]|nr:OB-fold nucleic acid binding domain-containing protein [bacterium]
KSFAGLLSRVDNRKVNKKVMESLIKAGALSSFGNRASLLASFDEIRNKVSKPVSLKGQQALFIEENKNDVFPEANLIINIKEYPDNLIESQERELLGFSLSAKPVEELTKKLDHKATHKISEISEGEISELVKIAAVVREVRVVVTRTGSEMAFVKVEDGTGNIDLVVFPKLYLQTKKYWIGQNAILVSGKLDSRNDETTLLVEAIDTNESIQSTNDDLYIKIPSKATAETLKKLRNLLLSHLGNQNITLVFEKSKKRIRLPIKISWSDKLEKEISDLLENTGVIDVQ